MPADRDEVHSNLLEVDSGNDTDSDLESYTSFCEYCPCSLKRIGCTCLCCLIAAIIVIIVASEVNRSHKLQLLEPLLSTIQESKLACPFVNCSVCALCFDMDAASAFDLSPAENTLFGLLFGQLASQNISIMKDILQGAHVEIAQDSGSRVYEFLDSLPGAYERISSHVSDRTQYGVPEGRVVSTLLIGTVGPRTWLQLEGHQWNPVFHPVQSMGHILDYVRYKSSGMNVGPLGLSQHTDWHPLVIAEAKMPSEVCSAHCG